MQRKKLRYQDSNLDWGNQNPMCYHYTIPQFQTANITKKIITQKQSPPDGKYRAQERSPEYASLFFVPVHGNQKNIPKFEVESLGDWTEDNC